MKLLVAMTAAMAATAAWAQPAAKVTLAGFECGLMEQERGRFSDTFRFQGEKKPAIAGCYLIRHPKGVLLWDTGLTPALIGTPAGTVPGGVSLKQSIADRLKAAGMAAADVTHVGISHYHADHSGGAAGFPNAELLIGDGDWEAVKTRPADDRARSQLQHWLDGKGKMRAIKGDLDLFGDGSVVMLAMPGHTPGHSALLVRLPKAGAVLLSGDQYHFRENRAVKGVPTFNHNRADTLASHDRFEEIARNLKARVVVQHDPRDMAELPKFPAGLE